MSAGKFRVVIPARYASTRFPGKALAVIAGETMIRRVHGAALASGADEVWIATDDERIATECHLFTDRIEMTSPEHRSGTDRVAEVAARRGWRSDEVIVNLQGDAPLTPPAGISRAAGVLLAKPSAAIATLCAPITAPGDYTNPNIVKVVFDATGRALYFSRAPIPSRGHGAPMPASYRHIGLYAYRAGALQRLAASREPCPLEDAERLEQLRALWLGMELRVDVLPGMPGPDVDTPEDVDAVTAWIAAQAAV